MSSKFENPFTTRPWMSENGAAVGTTSMSINSLIRGIVAGGITGGIEICTFPTEYVKTQLQLDEKGDKKKYTGIWDCVRKTVKKHGILGLYRGLSILIAGSIPKSAVRFGGFEFFKSCLIDENGYMSPSKRVLAGLGAGIVEAVLAVTPMETIKVKFIYDLRSGNPQYRGLVHGVGTIIRQQGLTGVYQGVTATILKQGSNQAIRFFVMETLKEKYKGGDPSVIIPKWVVGISGVIAGAASALGNNPLDVIKTRMQGLESSKYRNTFHCAYEIWTNEGPFAFYKGTVPRFFRVCLDVGITFMVYESFMDCLIKIWP